MADDLDRRLRGALDRVPVSDVWGEATRPGRPEHPLPHGPSRGRRVVIAAFALLLFVGAVGSVLILKSGPSALAPPPIGRGPSTGLVMDGALRCTVSVGDRVVPGEVVPVTFTLTNVSSQTQQMMVGLSSFTYTIESSDGSSFDTQPPPGRDKFEDQFPLAPEASWSPHYPRLRVQFPGPITITPRCMQTVLDPIQVDVQVEGAAPSAETAVASAVVSASGLFDGCLPAANGAPVVGVIRPPKGSSVAPMPARCSAHVQTYDGFDVVSFLIVAPPNAGDVPLPDGIPTEQNVGFPSDPTFLAVIWRFVVTQDRAMSVYTFGDSRTQPTDAIAPLWLVSANGWNGPGGAICGTEGGGGGGGPDGPIVEFVNVCPGF